MSRSKSTKQTVRLTLDLSVQSRATLDNLRVDSNADSLSEVIRKAIDVYALLVKAEKNGEKIQIGERQVVLL